MSVLGGLEPKAVFSYFEALCAVPHGSGNTKQISDLCVGFAKELGLRYRQDSLNNVIIWKDASEGYENAEPILLQGHMDMVCTKTADCAKDMAAEGLDLRTDGVEVWADKTTLGGDNCIAVAMILALLADETLEHPPIEALFTVDEETGMDGAFGVELRDVKSRKLLNLDSEDEGVFTVSCAGGVRLDAEFSGTRVECGGEQAYRLTVRGLLGGHSGADIHLGRGNANTLMARVLYSAMERFAGLRLADFRGGRFDNVICSQCDAVALVPAESAAAFEAFVRDMDATLKNEYAASDAGVELFAAAAEADEAFCASDSRKLLTALFLLPQGVQEVSHDFPGLTQTSLNLGVVSTVQDGLRLTVSIRSCIASQKELMVKKVSGLLTLFGAAVSTRNGYPGWQYVKDSAFRELLMQVYRDQTGKEARLEATHGGLECGLFIEKLPGLDVVSIGPDLRDIHSPNERLNVASTERVYRLIREVLKRSK